MLTTRVDKDFYKKFFALLGPMVFQNFMVAAVGAGDAIMLGFVSQEAMAAVSLCTNIQFIESMFTGAFAGAATILSAQYWGKGDKLTVERTFALVVRYSLVASLVFFLAALLIPEQLIRIFTNEPELIRIGTDYIRLASVSYLATGLSQCYLCIMKTTGQAKLSSILGSTANVLDLILNAVFIFGLFGVPAMGAKGAALTTSISSTVCLLLAMAYSPKMAVGTDVRVKVPGVLNKDFIRLSVPHIINGLIWGVGTSIYSVIIGHLGVELTAAHSAANVVRQLVISITWGMGGATNVLLGNVLGSGDLELGRAYGRKLSHMSFVCGAICAGLILAGGMLVAQVMVLTEGARTLMHAMIWISAIYIIGRAINDTVVMGVFMAGGDVNYDAYSVAVTMWLIILPLAAASAFIWKLPGIVVYFILSMDEVIKLPWLYLHYRRLLWVKNITRNLDEA